MAWTVVNALTTEDDWKETRWTIDKQDTEHVHDSNWISISQNLVVTLHQLSGDRQASGQYNDNNGLLAVYFPTSGSEGEVEIVMSMVQYDDGTGDPPDKHITILTTDGDPENAGVMGAEEGGGGP